MSNHPQTSIHADRSTLSSAWFDALVEESANLELLGVHSAMLSVRLRTSDEPARAAAQARTLFGLILRPTDRVEQTTPISFSLLLAPQRDLADTIAQATSIADALSKANLESNTGFAQRRPGESLIDTWARSEAELDRAAFRSDHPNGLTVA